MIYHIASAAAWADAPRYGRYIAPSLESEGFIHCSTRDQVLPVANEFYRGQSDLVLLCLDEEQLQADLVWETPAHPGPAARRHSPKDELFPHLYGELNLDAVDAVFEFREGPRGFTLPRDLP